MNQACIVNSIRCVVCNKKTLTGIYCKCESYVCMYHRHPESHGCTYQAKQLTVYHDKLKEKLMNGSVKPDKIDKL